MTERQEKILESALELFANQGYNATPTSRIAKKAGVSEGLIFRHFVNKEGLLKAIMGEAERRLKEIIMPVLEEKDPTSAIRKMIELPFGVKEEEYDFWKLQFKLKWEENYYNPENIKPLTEKLVWAFSQLGYKDPEKEAMLMTQFNDTVGVEILRGNIKDKQAFKEFLLEKYGL